MSSLSIDDLWTSVNHCYLNLWIKPLSPPFLLVLLYSNSCFWTGLEIVWRPIYVYYETFTFLSSRAFGYKKKYKMFARTSKFRLDSKFKYDNWARNVMTARSQSIWSSDYLFVFPFMSIYLFPLTLTLRYYLKIDVLL